jgi:GDPmannose 4,6-dehydratase
MFVTQKIAKAAARIKLGLQSDLGLGNLDAKRDIGHSKEYVRAMWLMLQSDNADDYVIATGETHSVEEMVEVCFNYVGLDWKDYVYIDPAFIRPAEVDLLIGDPTKASKELNWKHEIGFKALLEEMVQYQLDKELNKNLNIKDAKSLIQYEIQSQLTKI